MFLDAFRQITYRFEGKIQINLNKYSQNLQKETCIIVMNNIELKKGTDF